MLSYSHPSALDIKQNIYANEDGACYQTDRTVDNFDMNENVQHTPV